jgi:hypothetical protein
VLKIPEEIERLKKYREHIPKELIGQEKIVPFAITQRTQQIIEEVKKKI